MELIFKSKNEEMKIYLLSHKPNIKHIKVLLVEDGNNLIGEFQISYRIEENGELKLRCYDFYRGDGFAVSCMESYIKLVLEQVKKWIIEG